MLRVVASVPQAKLHHTRFHASELVLLSRTRTANADPQITKTVLPKDAPQRLFSTVDLYHGETPLRD